MLEIYDGTVRNVNVRNFSKEKGQLILLYHVCKHVAIVSPKHNLVLYLDHTIIDVWACPCSGQRQYKLELSNKIIM